MLMKLKVLALLLRIDQEILLYWQRLRLTLVFLQNQSPCHIQPLPSCCKLDFHKGGCLLQLYQTQWLWHLNWDFLHWRFQWFWNFSSGWQLITRLVQCTILVWSLDQEVKSKLNLFFTFINSKNIQLAFTAALPLPDKTLSPHSVLGQYYWLASLNSWTLLSASAPSGCSWTAPTVPPRRPLAYTGLVEISGTQFRDQCKVEHWK